MRGECIGTAYVKGHGLHRVFVDMDSTKHLILVSSSGENRLVARPLVQWRSTTSPAIAQEAGYTPPAPRVKPGRATSAAVTA